MSEFDLPKDWTVKVGNASKNRHAQHHELKNMTRPEVMRWLSEQGLINYKLESR